MVNGFREMDVRFPATVPYAPAQHRRSLPCPGGCPRYKEVARMVLAQRYPPERFPGRGYEDIKVPSGAGVRAAPAGGHTRRARGGVSPAWPHGRRDDRDARDSLAMLRPQPLYLAERLDARRLRHLPAAPAG